MTAPTPVTTEDITGFDLHDIQGNILRGYRMPNARHFALTVGNGGGARAFLGALVSGDGSVAPQVTTASDWADQKPHYCLNVAVTFAGLRALGVPESTLSLFPSPFRNGPAANAGALGDTGPSDPASWVMGGPANPPVHLLVSLFSSEHREPAREQWSAVLKGMFERSALTEAWTQDANALADSKVHFGYRDGIGQPRIEGAPGKSMPDMQPAALAGDFLLGKHYLNQYDGNFLGEVPNELGDNATYAALRIIKQEVRAFETFITVAGKRHNLNPELVAAKLMGRWRNGMPLTLSPREPEPHSRPIGPNQIDCFDFGPSDEHPTYFDDGDGKRCPVGAHIRRLNPRSGMSMGKPHSRRIIRRGIPYGPEFDASKPDDGIERGLFGFFICGDLGMQFEFIHGTWANCDLSAAGIRGTRDAILGAQGDDGGQFVLRTNDARDPIVFDNLPRFVTTRGSVYCLIPGVGGLRFLAGA
ncbi:MAG: hypothetical protein ABJD07_13535 [Gemmatimonadaceae bacterium]